MARLSYTIGWTCIGAMEDKQHDSTSKQTLLEHNKYNYFVTDQTDLNEVNISLPKFCKIDSNSECSDQDVLLCCSSFIASIQVHSNGVSLTIQVVQVNLEHP